MLPLPPPVTSRTNARVKALRAALSGKASATGDPLGIEGLHLVGELHKSGHDFETVFVREGSESVLEQGWPAKLRTGQWMRLSREVFDSAVTTATPQGIAATWIIQQPATPPTADGRGTVLLLEDLQDPGNVGTLIRSAEAFGASEVMVTPGTANHWNPKVVRSSAGSVFRMPVQRAPLEELGAQLRARGVRIFAGVGSFVGKHSLAGAHGVLLGRGEDAGAIQGEEGRQGRTEHAHPAVYRASSAPDADFAPPCAILIGNEGAGLSDAARRLADEQVSIPCSGVESLNAAVAGSVLLYEVLRQVPLRAWAQAQGLRA